MTRKKLALLLSPSAALALTFALAATLASGADDKAAPLAANAELVNGKGEPVGKASFLESTDGVRVALEAKGLTPGRHGIHFHETGKCEGPDFKSAGAHFAMKGTKHGLRNKKGPHSGDLPNIEVKGDGTVSTEFVANRVTLKEGASSLLKAGGTSIVIHAGPDDQKTDPSGNSGDRAVCGVITQAK
jgi:Cu-Zn family superoxide dismutase